MDSFKKILKQLKETSCDCEVCKAMCKRCPCMGTPEEIQRIIDAGFANRLMVVESWEGEKRIYALRPARVGREGQYAEWSDAFQEMPCTFLTKDGHCEIYDIRPVEARVAHHGNSDVDWYEFKQALYRLWDTEEGKKLVSDWLKGGG